MPDALDTVRSQLRTRGVLTLTATRTVPSVVEIVSGGAIRGSWWAHPAARAIYAVATALEHSPDVLTLKLVEGKVTFVHRSLWPDLVRFATDPGRWRSMLAALPDRARQILGEVERCGVLHLAGSRQDAAARASLVRRLSCIATSEHTPAGRHETVLTSWSRWVLDRHLGRTAAARTFEDARAALVAACGDLGEADPPPGGAPRPARRVTRRAAPSSEARVTAARAGAPRRPGSPAPFLGRRR